MKSLASSFLALFLVHAAAAQPVPPEERASIRAYATKDYYGAAELLQADADYDARAANLLGELYLRGEGVPRDPYEAIYWMRRAAAAGQPHPKLRDLLLLHPELPVGDRAALDFHEGRARAADTTAGDQYRYGLVLKEGRGTRPRPHDAGIWFLLAASHRHAFAQLEYGRLMFAEQEFTRARAAYEIAARQGHPTAQALFADFLLVDKKPTAAAQWYLKAAEANYAQAQGMIGILMTTGRGVPRDPVEGAKWLALSLERVAPERQELYERALHAVVPQMSMAQRQDADRRVRAFAETIESRP